MTCAKIAFDEKKTYKFVCSEFGNGLKIMFMCRMLVFSKENFHLKYVSCNELSFKILFNFDYSMKTVL